MLLHIIKMNIKESILASSWSEEDWKVDEREEIILKNIELDKSVVTIWRKGNIDIIKSR